MTPTTLLTQVLIFTKHRQDNSAYETCCNTHGIPTYQFIGRWILNQGPKLRQKRRYRRQRQRIVGATWIHRWQTVNGRLLTTIHAHLNIAHFSIDRNHETIECVLKQVLMTSSLLCGRPHWTRYFAFRVLPNNRPIGLSVHLILTIIMLESDD